MLQSRTLPSFGRVRPILLSWSYPTADPKCCDLVYTTNKAVLSGLVGVRLEYFFWRIWSSPQIHRNIRGSTVAREFLRISEGSSFIRTTPTQSPTSGRRLPDVRPVRAIKCYLTSPPDVVSLYSMYLPNTIGQAPRHRPIRPQCKNPSQVRALLLHRHLSPKMGDGQYRRRATSHQMTSRMGMKGQLLRGKSLEASHSFRQS